MNDIFFTWDKDKKKNLHLLIIVIIIIIIYLFIYLVHLFIYFSSFLGYKVQCDFHLHFSDSHITLIRMIVMHLLNYLNSFGSSNEKMGFNMLANNSLRKHAYSNILKILQPRKENFQMKNSDIFFIFLLKT